MLEFPFCARLESKITFLYCDVSLINHLSVVYYFWDIGKQNNPRRNAAQNPVSSGLGINCLLKPQSHIHDFGPGRATVHPDLASR